MAMVNGFGEQEQVDQPCAGFGTRLISLRQEGFGMK
jgi:hypothetical protein